VGPGVDHLVVALAEGDLAGVVRPLEPLDPGVGLGQELGDLLVAIMLAMALLVPFLVKEIRVELCRNGVADITAAMHLAGRCVFLIGVASLYHKSFDDTVK
jgi:hypothetical protein